MSMREKDKGFSLRAVGQTGNESADEIKFSRLKSVIKTRAYSRLSYNPWVTRHKYYGSYINTEERETQSST